MFASVENSVRYLFNLSNNLPSTQSSTILKSYYLATVRKLTLKGDIGLPQTHTKATTRCSHCSLTFKNEEASYRVQSERKQSKFVKKLLVKDANNALLTRYQTKFLQKLKRKGNDVKHNKLVIKCGVCQNETREKLSKPRMKKVSPKMPVPTPRKKKKRKRDKFIGLNKEAVLSVTPCKSRRSNSGDVLKTPTNLKRNIVANNTLFVTNKTVPVELKIKQRKQNRKAIQNLKQVLNSSKKSQSSSKLKQFLVSI